MLRIKLLRTGKKNQPHYRIVVTPMRAKRDGKYVEQVGYYNPITKELRIETELFQKWVGNGAQPTDTVASLFHRHQTAQK